MIHKIIGGRGKQRNIKNSINYLLRENKPEEQQYIEVLSYTNKEDLLLFNKLIPTEKKHPYVCGVLSFAEADIDPQVKFDLMNDFEEVLFAGIEPENRPPCMWVQHTDKGRLELNYLTFNQLQDGRAYTTYLAKRDNKLINCLTKSYDLKHNFKTPNEDNKLLVSGINKRLPADKKELLQFINDNVISAIVVGDINNRDDLEKYLVNNLNLVIKRNSDKYLSVVPNGADSSFKAVRLKGEIYEKGRDYQAYRTAPGPTTKPGPEDLQRTIDELGANYTKHYERKSTKNRSRYRKTVPSSNCRSVKEIEETNNIQVSSELSNPDTNSIINNKSNDSSDAFYSSDEEILNNKDNINDNRANYTKTTSNTTTTIKQIERRIDRIGKQQRAIDATAASVGKSQFKTRRNFKRSRAIFFKCINAIKRIERIRNIIKQQRNDRTRRRNGYY